VDVVEARCSATYYTYIRQICMNCRFAAGGLSSHNCALVHLFDKISTNSLEHKVQFDGLLFEPQFKMYQLVENTDVLRRRQQHDSGHAALRTWRWVTGHVVYLMSMKGLQR
jgi:hypothetical protein